MKVTKAKIPKGTVIIGTFPEGIKEAGRTYTVRVHSIDKGYAGDHPDHGPGDECGRHCFPAREAMVCWVGVGSYWHYAPVADCELIEVEL